jgi:hypothetical protein
MSGAVLTGRSFWLALGVVCCGALFAGRVERDDHFANLVFRIWLGEHPPDAELKAGLLGATCE